MNLSELFPQMSSELEQQLKEIDIGKEELEAAAIHTGIKDFSDMLMEGDPDESEFPEDTQTPTQKESGSKTDIWEEQFNILEVSDEPKNELEVEIEEESEKSTERQMTKKIMQESILKMRKNMESLSSSKKTGDEKKRVEDWEKLTGAKISLAAKELLITSLKTQPNAAEDIFFWILYGWNSRGDHNVVEMRNIQQAMQELINGILATQSGFKKESTDLITGFKECQKDTQNLVHSLREVLTKRRDSEVVVVPRPQSQTYTLQSTIPSTPSSSKTKEDIEQSPKRSLKEDAARLMNKLAKTPEEMKSICTPQVLYEVLVDIVKSMGPTDWEDLDSMNGIMIMNNVLVEELMNRTKGKKK